MNASIIVLIFIVCLYSSVQALDCITDNPCQLDSYHTESRGYRCFQYDSITAQCFCPGTGYEINRPCQLCNRSNPENNVCRNRNGKLVACLETDDYNTAYACLCNDGTGVKKLTLDADCDTTFTLAPRPTTTVAPTAAPSLCRNGGVFVSGICHCPSGFSGVFCQDRVDANLCYNINCKNSGVCAIRNPNGPYEAVCLCRYGTWGEYCELNGTLGFCSASPCLNGGACKENVVGSTRHAYCQCSAGYNGIRCEKQHYSCTSVGKVIDTTMYDQGQYIECTLVGTSYRAVQRSCPKGLRFNQGLQLCAYA